MTDTRWHKVFYMAPSCRPLFINWPSQWVLEMHGVDCESSVLPRALYVYTIRYCFLSFEIFTLSTTWLPPYLTESPHTWRTYNTGGGDVNITKINSCYIRDKGHHVAVIFVCCVIYCLSYVTYKRLGRVFILYWFDRIRSGTYLNWFHIISTYQSLSNL